MSMEMNIEDMILRQWERAGGMYALAAKQVRHDLEQEKQTQTQTQPQTQKQKDRKP